MTLSILICTLPERRSMLDGMLNRIASLVALLPEEDRNEVEVVSDDSPRTVPTGIKRNNLIDKSTGSYFIFLDDDDWISEFYVCDILNACKTGVDCVTFKGWMTTNGIARVEWCIRLGERYEARTDHDGITRYYRFPNHLCAFRKDLVKDVRFPSLWQGEDYQWACNIQHRLKTEVHIDKPLYHYIFLTHK